MFDVAVSVRTSNLEHEPSLQRTKNRAPRTVNGSACNLEPNAEHEPSTENLEV